MNAVKKVLFIVNKHAGTGYQPAVEGKIQDICSKREIECTIEFTRGKGHATELAKEATKKDYHLVAAVGGDGTINEVAKGLLHTSTPMGIIPRGSGNGLSRHLRIPLVISKAVDCLFSGDIIRMDTFTVNNKLSLNVSGIGFDGLIANHFGKDGKRGIAGYIRLTLKQYIQFKEFEALIMANGFQLKKKAFIIAIANSSQYGNNARIAPYASICDQILHINFLTKIPFYRLDMIFSFFKGTIHRSEFCEIIETDFMKITFQSPQPYHIDGEACGSDNEFIIKVLPSSLGILAPKFTKS